MAGAIQQVLEVLLLINFYLPWLWDRADALTWFLARHISWFHHNEIWGKPWLLTDCMPNYSLLDLSMACRQGKSLQRANQYCTVARFHP